MTKNSDPLLQCLASRGKSRLAVLTIAVLIPFAGSALAQSEAPATNELPEDADPTVGAPLELKLTSDASLNLVATLSEDGEPITFGLTWRIYSTTPDADGRYPLIEKTDSALPSLVLGPGSYIAHAAYGRAQESSHILLAGEPQTITINLNAGGLRLWADLGRGAASSVENVTFEVYGSRQDEYGDRQLITKTTDVGKVLRLGSGTYHIVSQFGAANAIVRTDVLVEAGKITDATIMHRASQVTLKLVNETGGEALADTQWTLLTPGGDTVTETIGAFPAYVLAEGEYEAIARHEEVVYNKTFNVEAGINREIELIAN